MYFTHPKVVCHPPRRDCSLPLGTPPCASSPPRCCSAASETPASWNKTGGPRHIASVRGGAQRFIPAHFNRAAYSLSRAEEEDAAQHGPDPCLKLSRNPVGFFAYLRALLRTSRKLANWFRCILLTRRAPPAGPRDLWKATAALSYPAS